MAKYTPEGYKKQVDRFVKGLPKAIAEGEVVAAQQLRTDMEGRIFTGGTKDIKGNTRGYKSASWKKIRREGGVVNGRAVKGGFQTSVVDMVHQGDLMRAVGLSEVKGNVGVLIQGGDKNINLKKVEGADKQYNSPVFEASKAEGDKAQEAFSKHLSDYINKFFD